MSKDRESLIALAPLGISDKFENYPGKSEMVCIVGGDKNWVIARDVFRPIACMLVNAFNEKYGYTDVQV